MATSPPIERSLEERVVHRFSYAVGLYHGAENACRFGKASFATYALPTYLLLGFSLENAFAAFLACDHRAHADYKGHDLNRALNACRPYGLIFAAADVQFVEVLAPLQRNFAFRYPEKVEKATLSEFREALRTVKSIIRDVEVG